MLKVLRIASCEGAKSDVERALFGGGGRVSGFVPFVHVQAEQVQELGGEGGDGGRGGGLRGGGGRARDVSVG